MAKQVESIGVTLLLSLLLLASVSASKQCRTGCQGRPTTTSFLKVHYETGHTYIYNFEGHTLATLPGQQGDGTKLQLKATAEVSILDNCQGVLKLKGVQVTGPDSHKYTHLNDLEAHPISFGLENGVVDSELCTNEADSEASVNIKRAVLSLFQVPPSESVKGGPPKVLDVFGLCPVYITSNDRGDTTTIVKNRDLNKCRLREHLRQDFASVRYHSQSDLQTTPLLESSQELRQVLKGGILNSAESHEKYLFRPFSNQEVGAKTTADSKLTLVSHSKKAAPEASVSLPRSIIFEPPHVGNTASSNAQTIVEALHKAQKAMPEYVGPTAAREFSNVVSILRHSTKDDLLSVYNQVKAGAGFKSGPKMFLDALFRAGTGDAVEVAVELLKSKKITGPQADLYYLQFAYTKHVTLKALTAAVTLLDQPEFSKLVYLGVGALGGRYCSDHNCEGVPEFDAFLEKLSHPLDGGCKSSNWDEELKVIAALKALHNVHHMNEATINKLRTCVLDDSLPTRVRSAVLDVFQSDACRVKQTSLEVLKNRQLDSELRIKAFLALIECPCNKMANALKEVLDSEPTYQVGSFIVSYLRNLRASANPAKENTKLVYGQVRTTKRFPLDFRKFSNNLEFSYFLDGVNLGATVESNVIYSQRSFLPRATTLNLTSELFGHSVNFLEVEFRQENLDLIAERLFGPKGYFNVHTVQELILSGNEKWTELESSVKQRLNHAIRGKRSVTKEALEEVLHKSVGPHHSEPDRELFLDLSTRLFGAEVGWFSFHDNVKEATKNAFDNTFNLLDKIVKQAKDFDHKVRQHNTFLDTELIYPTSLGLPLKLVASGSSAVHIDWEGKFDISQLMKLQNNHVHLKFVPSAAIEITSSFVVDAYAVEAGLKVATTLHTATGADVNVKTTGGVGLDVTFGLPIKKQDVISVQSEVLSTVQEPGKSEVDTAVTFASTPRREYHGCFDQLSPLTGLTFCGEMNFPWDPIASKAAFYPLNGPSKMSLTIENDDVINYHFRASLNHKDPNKQSLELLLETPDSKTNRKLGLLLERTKSPYYGLKAELSSPWKHLSTEVAFTDNDEEISLRGTLFNDAQEYTAKVGASVTGDPSHATYHPVLEYKTPQQKGSLVAQKGAKGQRLTSHYSVDGSITVDKSENSRKFTFNDVIFTTPHGKYKVEGSVSGEKSKSVATDLKVTYGENDVVFKSEAKYPSPSDLHLGIILHSSQYPDFGVNFIWDHKRDGHNLENTLVVVHGRDPNSNEAKFTFHQQAHYQFSTIVDFDFSTKNEVSYPLLSVLGKFEGQVTPKNLHLDLEASYEKHKFESELSAKTGVHKPGDYEIEFEAKALDNSIEFETKREIVAPDQSRFTTELEVKPGGKYELVADVTHHFERSNFNFQIDAVAKVHGQPNDYKLDTGLLVNQQAFETHYKALVGSTEYVDISVKYNKASGSPSGNVKVYLKEYLSGNAQFKFSGGKGSATLGVDIPKLNRKIKGTGDLQVSGSQHVANVDIYFNADKNPNHKIHFHTDSDIKEDAINSKNTLVVVDYTTEFNINGQLIGKLEDGQLKGEFDLKLPSEIHLTGKLDRTLHVRPTNSEGDVKLELTAQKSANSEPAKVTFEFAAKNVDTKQYSFDGQSKLAFHLPNGKDLAVLVAAKNIPQREQRVIEGQVVLQGSLIGEPLRLEFNSEIYEPYVTLKGHGSYGTGTVVDFSGKSSRTLKQHDDIYTGPFSSETSIEIRLPIEKLKHIKVVADLTGEVQEKKLQFVYNEVVNLDDKTYKLHVETNNEYEKGNNKLVLTLPNTEPKTYTSSWYFHADEYKTKDIVKGGFSWAKDEDSKLAVDVNGKKDLTDFNVHATLQTPLEKLKHAELSLKNKYVPAPKYEVATDLALTLDDKKLTIVSKLTPGVVPGLPNIDFTATHPKGKSRVFLFLQSKTKNDVSGKAELEWAASEGGKLTASGKANYESAQNFKVEMDVDSPQLKLNKWHIVLANKPAKTAKTLVISATEAGAPVVNGRLEYHVEDHENSYKAGVSGTVKVRDSPQPLKAEMSYNKFTVADNGEVGAAAAVTFSLGPKSFDASSKYTNKESRVSISLCPKAGECSVAEAHSVLKNVDLTHLEHEFGAKVDLKASGLTEGFILSGKTVRQPLSFDHTVELKLLNAKHTAYKLHSYLNEKSVGVVVTLPQRVIAGEGKLSYVKEKGESSLDLNFWLDKQRHPENKAGIRLHSIINPSTEGTTLQGEAKFSHPALQKDFAVSGKAILLHDDTILDATLDFDVFAKKNQKVTVVAKIVRHALHHGFNVTGLLSAKGKIVDITLEGGAEASTSSLGYSTVLNYKDAHQKPKDAQILFHLTFSELLIYVKSPTADLIKIERHVSAESKTQKTITGEVFILGLNPAVVDQVITLQDKYGFGFNLPQSSQLTTYKKNTPNKKLHVELQHDILTGFSIHVFVLEDGNKKDALYVGVDLGDNNFLKTHFTWSTDELKHLLEVFKHDAEAFLKQIKVLGHDMGEEIGQELKDVLEQLKKSEPDVKALISSYQNQLKELKEELEHDEGFTEASENMKKFISAVTKVVVEVSKKVTELADQSLQVVVRVRTAVQEMVNKLLPKVQEVYSKAVSTTTAVTGAILEQGSKFLLVLADFVKEHETELKKLVQIVQEFIDDAGKVVGKTVVQIRTEVVSFIHVLVEQLKALPVYTNLKEQYKHFVSQVSQNLVPEQAWAVTKEVIDGFKESLPTEELKDLLNAIENYLEKHVNKETVNDIEEWQLISNKALKALKSLVDFIRSHLPTGETTGGPSFLGLRLPFAVNALFEFPKFVALKFSPLLFLTSRDIRDLPTLQELIHTFRPTLNPLEWVPPFKAHGVLVHLHHFITLDGRHFTFKGTCAYVLLEDVVDGNFSVALDVASKSIVIADHHDSIEMSQDQSFKTNGQAAEYPYVNGDFVVWKDYYSVNVFHKAGLFVKCVRQHNFCTFHVSGFYFGKTRGLLGALDYEPWDDYKLPNGQVVSDVNEFGNSWKVDPSCPDVSGTTHHDHEMPEPQECVDVFSGSTSLRLGYFFVPSAPFREACTHIVADEATPEAKKEAACSIAAAYSLTASKHLHLSIPNDCVHCSVVGGTPVEVGDTVSVKVPQKSADVIIVIEQDTHNAELFKELVSPLVTTLTNDLKAKGISDVHFTLIGYGEATHNYPALYTTGGKLIFEGKTKNMIFLDHVDPFKLPLDTGEKRVKYLTALIQSELGLGAPAQAYHLGATYPFKIGTSKVLVGVVANTKSSAFSISLQQLAALYSTKVLRDRGVAFHLIAPVDDLHITNKDAKTTKTVVGFDSDHVYVLSDAKKKSLEGNAELRKSLTFKNNLWIPIALDSYGVTYPAQNFLEGKASARKQFLQVLSHRVAESLAIELHEDCTCRLVNGMYPFSECKVTNRKEREPLAQIKGVKGVKG